MPVTLRTDIDVDQWLAGLHLDAGSHTHPEQGMCVMEAIAWVTSSDFNATPDCVSPVIRRFAATWNDDLCDDEDRDRLLKPILLNMVGTNTGCDDDLAWMVVDWLVRVHAPAWLRLAGLTDHADQLERLPEATPDTLGGILLTLDAARAAAVDAAGYTAWAAAWAAAGDAARAAAGYTAWAAARAAARDAARDAAGDAAWAAARAAARGALAPTVALLQESAVDLLRRMCDHAKGV